MSDAPVREMFRWLADALPAQPALVDSVMRRIEEPAVQPRRRKIGRWLVAATVGAAACTAACFVLWVVPFFSLTPSVTFAQVEAAVAAQKWMHLKFDNGQELWITTDCTKQFHIEYGKHIVAFDHSIGLDLRYSPGDEYISDLSHDLTRLKGWKPGTRIIVRLTLEEMLGFSMNLPEGGSSAKTKEQSAYMERHAEPLDGRRLARFDGYGRDALGRQRLYQQVWVDPKTRLPVRVRRLMHPNEQHDLNREYTVGDCEFPDHGPQSIYDLGVPRNLPIVKFRVKTPPEVAKVAEAVRRARDRFPTSYRLIIWPDKPAYGQVEVLYRKGAVKKRAGDDNERNGDWSGVNVRQARYFTNLRGQDPKSHLPHHVTAEQVLAWVETQQPASLHVSDGKRAYSKGRTSLEISTGERMGFNTSLWPTDCQWPVTVANGPYVLAPRDIDPIPGTIVLRKELGNRRDDFYIDPAHDSICVRWLWWEKRGDQWVKTHEQSLSDLRQLPQGQWFATKKCLKHFANPERNTRNSETLRNQDIRLLTENEFPPDAFNGEKIYEESKHDGTTINVR
jgi:hypothetical protein